MFTGVSEVMYFVADREQAASWYARLVDVPVTYVAEADHYVIRVGAHEMGFHEADDMVPGGPAGQVAYWEVDDFDAAVAKAQRMGAKLYRGPLRRPSGQVQCQMKDPFGNVLGLLGPSGLTAPSRSAEVTSIAPPAAPVYVAVRALLAEAWLDRDVLVWIRHALRLPKVVLLPLDPPIAVAATRLPDSVPLDPADRLIVATARLMDAELVTRDEALRAAPDVRSVW